MEFLRKHVLHNFALKALSLASAFLLWSAVANEPVAEVAHNVPIEFEHVPDNVLISSRNLPQAQIWIRGPQRLVRQVNPGDLHVTIDLDKSRGNAAGERTFSLVPSQIHHPFGVEVVEVIPSEVHLTLMPAQSSPQPATGETK